MNILLPGSWEAFRGWGPNGCFIPEEILEEILLLLKKEQQQAICEQIKDKYILGFKKENQDSIRIRNKKSLEREETRVHCSDCHPGRFLLNPDKGVRAVSMSTAALCCGGYVMSSQKHRKLSSEIVKYDAAPGQHEILTARSTGQKIIKGLQDVYFLGGRPLLYWSFGSKMGMKLVGAVGRGEGMRVGFVSENWMWRSRGDADNYRLLKSLPRFGEWEFKSGGLPTFTSVRDARNEQERASVYVEYLQRQEQNMIDGKNTFA